MKKTWLAVSLLFAICLKVRSSQDITGSMRPAMWRSSFTDSVDSFVQLATGAIHVHGVFIDSYTVNNPSFFCLFNTTITNANIAPSTACYMDTNIVQISSPTAISFPPTNYPFDVYFSTGVVYNKSGRAKVRILWDYVIPVDKRIGSTVVPFTP